MKKILLTLVLMVGVVLGLFAQKLTYQAVIRDNNQQLVVNTAVKATVTITFTSGAPYQAEFNGSTNLHGLLSIEFGDETLLGRDWTDATIAVRVVNAATPSTVYVNDDARPVSAVPYALSVNGVAIQNYLTEHNYVDKAELDSRHYLRSDSAVITAMQDNIATNKADITTNTADIAALVGRMNTFNTNVCDSVKNCDFSGNTSIQNMLQQLTVRLDAQDIKIDAQNAKIDSLAHLVDSLAKLPHGGGEVADGQPCPGAAKVTDYDNNEYNTVKIGNQCWMKENLKTTHYANSTSISYGGSYESTTTAYLYYPNGNSGNVSTHGYLYNWKAVMDTSSSSEANPSGVQGICPTGWHVPSDAEWTQLTEYVKSKAEYKCDEGADNIANALSAATGWQSPSKCGAGHSSETLNKTGFSAVPAGGYFSGFPSDFGSTAYFWSATHCGGTPAWYRYLSSNDSYVTSYFANKNTGLAVRCLRDAGTGGDEPTPCTPTSSTHNIEISISELPYTFGDTTFQTGTTAGTYTLHRTNVGGCDSTITINLSFFTCGTDKVMDVDNNEYNTVAIGNQCWMKENMKTTKYANNTAVNNKKMFNPNNNPDNVAIFGKLYNWSAATRDSSTTYPAEGQVKVQGICPTGWHVPSKAEFGTLTNYVNDKSDCKCGAGIANALSSPTGWNNSGTTGCNAGDNSTTRNKTGFSAVPPGYYYVGIGTSGYDEFGGCAYFWSATQRSDDNKEACSLYLTKISVLANESNREKTRGFSVRCLKD